MPETQLDVAQKTKFLVSQLVGTSAVILAGAAAAGLLWLANPAESDTQQAQIPWPYANGVTRTKLDSTPLPSAAGGIEPTSLTETEISE